MMGWERNADVIKLAAYAPTLQNYDPVNGQWTVRNSSSLGNPHSRLTYFELAQPHSIHQQA